MRFKEFNTTPAGIDPEYYKKLAQAESSNNPLAQAETSSAAGLYQFTKGTWKDITERMGKDYTLEDRFDPNKSKEAVEYFTKINSRYLQNKIGEEPNEVELYLAHFLGMGASSSLLSALRENPNMSVAEVVSDNAIEANKSVFLTEQGQPKTVKDIYNWSAKKIGSPSFKVEEESPTRSDVYRQAERPEAVVESTQTIIDKGINLYTSPELTTFVDESGITAAPKKEEEPKKKEPKATQKAKQELKKKEAEAKFLSDLLSGKAKAPDPKQQAYAPAPGFGSFILPKAQELGIFQEGGKTGNFIKDWWYNADDVRGSYQMASETDNAWMSHWINDPETKKRLTETFNVSEAGAQEIIEETNKELRTLPVYDTTQGRIADLEDYVYNHKIQGFKIPEHIRQGGEKEIDSYLRSYMAGLLEPEDVDNPEGLYFPDIHSASILKESPSTLAHEITHGMRGLGAMNEVLISSFDKKYNNLDEFIAETYYERAGFTKEDGKYYASGQEYAPEEVASIAQKLYPEKYQYEEEYRNYEERDGLYPRVMGLRREMGLKPGQEIDLKSIQSLESESLESLRRHFEDEEIINILNTVADNSTPTRDRIQSAKKGGQVKKYPDGGTAPKQPEDPEYTLQFPYTNLQAPYLYPQQTQQRQVQDAFLNWYQDPSIQQRLQDVHGLSPEEAEQYLTRGVDGVIKEGNTGSSGDKAVHHPWSGNIVTTDLSDTPVNVHEVIHRSELDERLAEPLVEILGKPSGVFRKYKQYLSQPKEAYGNFAEFRGRLGVQPGERIDEAKFDKLVKEKGLTEENFYRAFDKDKIIKALNTVAFTDRLGSNNTTQVAQEGAEVGNPLYRGMNVNQGLQELLDSQPVEPQQQYNKPYESEVGALEGMITPIIRKFQGRAGSEKDTIIDMGPGDMKFFRTGEVPIGASVILGGDYMEDSPTAYKKNEYPNKMYTTKGQQKDIDFDNQLFYGLKEGNITIGGYNDFDDEDVIVALREGFGGEYTFSTGKSYSEKRINEMERIANKLKEASPNTAYERLFEVDEYNKYVQSEEVQNLRKEMDLGDEFGYFIDNFGEYKEELLRGRPTIKNSAGKNLKSFGNKILLFSPSANVHRFVSQKGKTNRFKEVIKFKEEYEDANYLILDNGRFQSYYTNPEGLDEYDIDSYMQNTFKQDRGTGYNFAYQGGGKVK